MQSMRLDLWLLSRLFGSKRQLLAIFLSPLILLLISNVYLSSLFSHEPLTPATNMTTQVPFAFTSLLFNLPTFGTIFSNWFRSAKVSKAGGQFLQSRESNIIDLNDVDGMKTSVQKEEIVKENIMKISNKLDDLKLKYEALSKTVDTKEKDSNEKYQKENFLKEKVLAVTKAYRSEIDNIKNQIKVLESKLPADDYLQNICNKDLLKGEIVQVIQKNIIFAFKEVLSGNSSSKYNFFSMWLDSIFFSHENLKEKIISALREESSYTEAKVDFRDVEKVVETLVLKNIDVLKNNLSEFFYRQERASDDKIHTIVKEAIMIYDADKIGIADYALESGGGQVIGTRCSKTYLDSLLQLFQLNSPRTVIQPEVQPGRCWSFKGNEAVLVIKLSATIYPTGFCVEHIPLSLSPTGSINSAPKNFSVWGLDSEFDSKGDLLGEYMYDINGDPLQYFETRLPSKKSYSCIELHIQSNHGNLKYTCLYRFRVHGKRA